MVQELSIAPETGPSQVARLAYVALLVTIGYMTAIVALGKTVDQPNLFAGLVTLSVSCALTVRLAVLSPSARLALSRVVIPVTMFAAIAALVLSPPELLKGPAGAFWSQFHQTLPVLTQVHPNTVAFTIVPGFVAAFSFAWERRSGPRWIWPVAVLAGLTVFAISGARTELVAASVGVWLTFALKARGKIGVGATLMSFAIAALLAGPLAEWAWSVPTLRDRVRYWPAAAAQLADAPLFGIGYGRIAFTNADPTGGSIHNLALQVALDFGVLGGLLLGVSVILGLAAAVGLTRGPGVGEWRQLAVAGIGSVASALVAGLAESVLESPAQFGTGYITLVSPVLFLTIVLGLPQFSWRPGTKSHA